MTFLKTEKSTFEYLTDKQLVKSILQEQVPKRKRELQEVLYGRYAEKVYFKCYSIVKSEAIAKDLTHDIIIKIFSNLNKYSGISEFHAWVSVVAYNYCISWLHKEKRIKIEDIDNYSSDISIDDDGAEIAEKLLQELQLNQLEKLFEELKEVEKIVLLMRYQDGLAVKEIASILKIGSSAVKMRLKRGRDRLVALLKEADNEEKSQQRKIPKKLRKPISAIR